MQIVIDIDEDTYNEIYRAFDIANRYDCPKPTELAGKLMQAIHDGTPLPKGHWIHRTQDGGCYWEECSVCHTERAFPTKYCPDCGTYMYADIRTDAPTIIEADKEVENENTR